MRRIGKLLLIILFLTSTGTLTTLARSKPGSSEEQKAKNIQMSEFKLKNGLRVIISEDHTAPTYSICVAYNTGSRNERNGRTGFAHLFEHMMFEGSANVGKGEHFILIQNNGGNMNGTTNEDRTVYFETLPANQLPLGLFLESDRMRALNINQANLNNQRNAVQEERRLGVDNQPYGQTEDVIPDLVYDNFPYKHSVIGSMADLDAATVQDVADFFRVYYAPNNAVLALVGDVKTDDALAAIKKYFEDIPEQPAPPEPDMTEPEQKGERRKTLDDALAPMPRLDILFKTPQGNTHDWYALRLLGNILSSGQSSRLYQKLVKEKEVAANAYAYEEERRGPSVFTLTVDVRPGKDLAEVENLIYAEIERLKSEPVADWEMEKVHAQIRRQRANQLQGTLYRAILISQNAVYYNEPGLINTMEEKYNAVTKEDLQRVATTFLKESNRTVVTSIPKPKETPSKAK